MTSNSILIEAARIGRQIPGSENWLFREVSFSLSTGSTVAVLGVSGAGKSLFLRALALLDPLDEGQILWRGSAIVSSDVPHYRSRVIYVHQKPSLLDGTVEENLRYPLTFAIHRHRSYDAQRVRYWLQQVGRDASFLDKSSRNLSGGESQLVALLRAVILEPDVLLLDEPTGAIDPQTQDAVEHLLRQWMQEQNGDRSMVLVSHDRHQAIRLADRVMRMDAGRLTDDN